MEHLSWPRYRCVFGGLMGRKSREEVSSMDQGDKSGLIEVTPMVPNKNSYASRIREEKRYAYFAD